MKKPKSPFFIISLICITLVFSAIDCVDTRLKIVNNSDQTILYADYFEEDIDINKKINYLEDSLLFGDLEKSSWFLQPGDTDAIHIWREKRWFIDTSIYINVLVINVEEYRNRDTTQLFNGYWLYRLNNKDVKGWHIVHPMERVAGK